MWKYPPALVVLLGSRSLSLADHIRPLGRDYSEVGTSQSFHSSHAGRQTISINSVGETSSVHNPFEHFANNLEDLPNRDGMANLRTKPKLLGREDRASPFDAFLQRMGLGKTAPAFETMKPPSTESINDKKTPASPTSPHEAFPSEGSSSPGINQAFPSEGSSSSGINHVLEEHESRRSSYSATSHSTMVHNMDEGGGVDKKASLTPRARYPKSKFLELLFSRKTQRDAAPELTAEQGKGYVYTLLGEFDESGNLAHVDAYRARGCNRHRKGSKLLKAITTEWTQGTIDGQVWSRSTTTPFVRRYA